MWRGVKLAVLGPFYFLLPSTYARLGAKNTPKDT